MATKTDSRRSTKPRRKSKAVASKRSAGAPGSKKPTAKVKKLSRLRKPEEMSLEAWQVALRGQYGRQQDFRLKNVGDEPIFSQFEVTNPQTDRTYRVAIRSRELGDNYCSCPDFSVNTLGTCKHIEFTLGKLEKKRGSEAAFATGFQPAFSEVFLRYGARREVIFRAGSDCPDPFLRYARRYFDADGKLTSDAYGRFHAFLKKTAAGQHEIRCYDDAISFVAQVRDQQALTDRVDRVLPDGVRSAAFKRLLKTSLYSFQRQGALFAARAGRCLIADDMGLGKTIQALAAVEILARAVGLERVLIVSPTSLKHQWKSEIEKFTDREALVVEGLLPRRETLYAADSFYKLVNYDVVHRDLEAIERWQPELIVLDEAQRIKNWKTRTAQTVKQLQSPYAIVLTGTPLENRLEELHSIVEFVDRFHLGPMFRFLSEHQHVDESGRVVGYRNLSKISKTLEPILIRRTKDKVLKQLPDRLEKRFFVPMTPQQMEHHEENRETVAKIVQRWRRHGFLSEADQLRLQISLQNMRMSCDSTYLLDQTSDHGVKADEVLDLLTDILEDPDAKVVIFSQWVRMHELIVNRLKKRPWNHVFFFGGVPGPKRKQLIDRFKQDPTCRLFLSTDAGGVGLNLQNASAVVNLDQPWNPAVLEQRIGRVHRLGQKRPVQVVHLIAQGTIEEGMLGLLDFKKSMFTGVLDGGKDEVFLGGTKLKHFMESVETATGPISPPPPVGQPKPANGKPPQTEAHGDPTQPPSKPGPTPQEQAWSEVAAAGLALLDKLGRAVLDDQPSAGRPETRSSTPTVRRDEKTGQSYLQLPLPPSEAISKVAELLTALTQQL